MTDTIRKTLCTAIVIFLMVSISACSEVIDLKTDRGENLLVIYGKVTDGTAGNDLFIGRTSAIGSAQEPVLGAEVALLEDGVTIGLYDEREEGNYRLNLNGDSARVGRTYEVQVSLPDGRVYKSLPASMPGQAAIDQVRFDASVVEVEVNQAGLEVKRNLIQLFVDTEIVDQEKDFYLKWDIIETYSFQERIRNTPIPPPPCFVTNNTTGQNVFLFNGEEIKVPVIRDQLLSTSEIDSRFAFDYYFSVVQTTMDKDAHDYWKLIGQISNSQGSIFDQPSAAVPGNFRNLADPDEEVLGYFEVVRSDTNRVRVRGDALDFYVSVPCPQRPPANTEPRECVACLLIKNSSDVKPYFWF
ncbi:MAG: DUF4249 domain-containing protein [Roseivirga sp.]|nr:DUF4249 domain-containing protein [Roseivirga sp.]